MIRCKYIAPYNIPPRVLDDVSLTIPDQALSVRQILERYAVGASIDASQHIGSFDDNADFDDFAPTESPDFDLADIQTERDALDGMRDARREQTSPLVPADESKETTSADPETPPENAPSGREKPAT